jgi:acyl-phosphate glycerol 3-phosphate acyltransferase
MLAILVILAAYLIGAIPFGYLVARWRGVDIFAHGSGNIGATNVGRVLGRKFGVLVFVLDFAKGALAVGLARLAWHTIPIVWNPALTRSESYATETLEVTAGLTAFLGHLFPIYLKFRGGKGVATGAGAVFVLLPIPALAGLCVWIVVVVASRYVSLASIAAVATLCAVHLCQPSSWSWTEPRTWFCLIAGGLVIVRHAGNIVRLLKGTENQLKENIVTRQLSKSLHVLALGMWFGMSVFFTFVVALSLFNTFETLAQQDPRETWFPQPTMYKEDAKEQGTRAAGYAVGPMFLWYFALQGVCGFIALATALSFLRPSPSAERGASQPSLGARAPKIHRWRVNLLIAALALVLIGWPIEQHVSTLRTPRNQATEAYLQDRNPATQTAMQEARTEFGRWHFYSILLNLATIVCVTGAMALAGNLEGGAKRSEGTPSVDAAVTE